MRRDVGSGVLRLGVVVASALVITSCGGGSSSPTPVEKVSGGPTGSYVVAAGVHKIKHVIVIMQENRSFDSYFGTFPGANGIPMQLGKPKGCVTDPVSGTCTAP